MRSTFLTALILACLSLPNEAGAASLALGSSDHAVVMDAPGLGGQEITVEGWFRSSSAEQLARLLYIGQPTGSVLDGAGLLLHDGFRSGKGHSASVFVARMAYSATGNSARLEPGVWTHLAIVRRDTMWLLYRNGMLVGNGRLKQYAPLPRFFLTSGFAGEVDEVRVWSRALDGMLIRRRMSAPLAGTEDGLIAWYPIEREDSVAGTIVNRARATSGTLAVQLQGGRVGPASAPKYAAPAPWVSFTEMPRHLQFYPRTSSEGVRIRLAGVVTEAGCDSVAVELSINDTLLRRQTSKLLYTPDASFEFEERIVAGLHLTTVRLHVRKDGEWRYVAEGADLIAGDAIVICGQSNSHPTNAAATWTSNFVRSFGVQTANANYTAYDLSDTSWGPANGHGHGQSYTGPYLVGVWGLQLASRLIDSLHVPICIINGGAGGSSIQLNQRNDDDPLDPATIYGRTLLRATSAGIRDRVREIFWHQGESNTLSGYHQLYSALREDWLSDYPALERIYLFQIRPGCGGEHSALRELQRTMGDSFPDVTPIATVGIPDHDGCHYALGGYITMGDHVARRLLSDRGITDESVVWPSIRRAWYGSARRDTIVMLFETGGVPLRWSTDTIVGSEIRRLADAFILDSAGTGAVDSGWVSDDTVWLALKARSDARTISYVPNKYYPGTTVIYQGPWLLREDGLGAFSFHQIPIAASAAGVAVERTGALAASLHPNPASDAAILQLSLLRAARVSVAVVDVLGRVRGERRALMLDAGPHRLPIDLAGLEPGGYRCTVRAAGVSWSAPLIVR